MNGFRYDFSIKRFYTNKYSKPILLLLILILLFVYFKTFFTMGIYFDGVFLKKEGVDSICHYTGFNTYGNYHIIVNGQKNKDENVDVMYRLPNNINRQFTVNFIDNGDWEQGIVSIMDNDGIILFEGYYREDNPFLIDKNGKPVMDMNVLALVNGESPYNEEYKIPLKQVADIAHFNNDTIRGKYHYLIIAFIIFIIILIDIKYPLFFFNLEHFLDVRDPEPSDFYLYMQKASHYVLPVIGIGFMIAAII